MATANRLKLFAGNSHPELAKELAKKLGIGLSPQEMKYFSNGEIYFRPLESVRGADVFVLQTASDNVNEDLMELFIMLDSFKRSFAKEIHVVMPHYGYARQDRVASSREPISAKLMADLISKAGADHLITMSLHSGQTQGFFDFPVDNIHTHAVFYDYFKKKKLKDVVVVSPDAGGGKAAKRLADPLGVKIAIINKSRPAHNKVEVMSVVGDVKGKTCIVFDDMIDTGGSVAAAHEALIKAGAKKDIYLAATHPVFSGPCIERLKKAKFKEVVVTNSIPLPKEKQFPGLKVISVAPVLGTAIKCIHAGKSVSGIWEL
jgi:ribose-phosphate pyrophosphokinase